MINLEENNYISITVSKKHELLNGKIVKIVKIDKFYYFDLTTMKGRDTEHCVIQIVEPVYMIFEASSLNLSFRCHRSRDSALL